MTEIDPKNLEEMKRFLFHELSVKERETLEECFFAQEDFFYDLMELENSLTDAYAREELTGEDLKRFEASLEKSPERREKIKNAIALNSLIRQEKQSARKTVGLEKAQPSFWEKISSFFTLKMSAAQYAAAALLFLLVSASGFLLYERFRLKRELANLQNNQKTLEELQKQERDFRNQLNETRRREQNLQNLVNETKGESEILNKQLESEKNERERLERELDRLKNLQKNLPPENQPPQPAIATVILSPFVGSRGGGSDKNIKTIKLDSNVKTVAATLQLPKEATAELFLARFKGETIASKQKPQATESGIKFITVTLPADRLSTEEDNVISVFGEDGVRYDFILKAQK